MTKIVKTVLVPHSTKEMFELVSDIENYSQYLPWCVKSEVISEGNNIVVGALYVEYLKIKTEFTTQNIHTPYSLIEISLIKGPFKTLHGKWEFISCKDLGCKINFCLEYQFANKILEKCIGPVFDVITKNILNCFIKEANKKLDNASST